MGPLAVVFRGRRVRVEVELPPARAVPVLRGHAPFLLHERLKHRIRGVFIKLDADAGPEVVGQFVQLPASGNGHQQGLRLLIDGEFGDLNRLGDEVDRAAQVQRDDDNSPATRVLAEQRSAQRDQDRKPEARAGAIRIDGAHLDRKLVLSGITVADEFLRSCIEVLLSDSDALAKRRRYGLV